MELENLKNEVTRLNDYIERLLCEKQAFRQSTFELIESNSNLKAAGFFLEKKIQKAETTVSANKVLISELENRIKELEEEIKNHHLHLVKDDVNTDAA